MKKCSQCGRDYDEQKIDSKKFPKKFCSYGCYEHYRQSHEIPNCKCLVCGKNMYIKPYRLSRLVDLSHITCCKKCSNILKETTYLGEKNHQFGLKGEKNSSFKNQDLEHNGYIYEYRPGHPFGDKSSRVRQHRLVVEDNWEKFDEKYFTVIDGKHYLKPDYVVHHKNEVKSDNRLDNLDILTKSEHSKLHATETFLNNEKVNKAFKENWR